jgi:hypothetical protein
VIAEGVGTCSTLESKYRYRVEKLQDANCKPLRPSQQYWQTRDPALLCGGDPGVVVRKIKGEWLVVRLLENRDPADYWHTCRSMSFKRGFVGGTRTGTAASDMFELRDDLPDYDADVSGEPAPEPLRAPQAKAPAAAAPVQAPPQAAPPQEHAQPEHGVQTNLSEAQVRRLYAIAKESGWSGDAARERMAQSDVAHVHELSRKDYEAWCEWFGKVKFGTE